jgi:hypothetical protein
MLRMAENSSATRSIASCRSANVELAIGAESAIHSVAFKRMPPPVRGKQIIAWHAADGERRGGASDPESGFLEPELHVTFF